MMRDYIGRQLAREDEALATVLVALVLLATAAPAGAGPMGRSHGRAHHAGADRRSSRRFMVLCALHDGS